MDANNMPVGAYGKDDSQSNKQVCEECGIETDLLFILSDPAFGQKMVCEGCYKQYWLEKGLQVS